jgi:hypothetical protein
MKPTLRLRSATKIKTLILGIAASLCLATQCNKEEEKERPPTATNTFSALVNGEPFVKAMGWITSSLVATYNPETKRLLIRCSAYGGEFAFMHLIIFYPRIGENTLSYGHITSRGGNVCAGYGCENCGRVFITKFDIVNRIVSGTFEFSGRCTGAYDPRWPMEFRGDSIVHITEGRFDIRLNIIYSQ